MAKDLKHYMALPYTVILKADEEGDFIARIDELSGCIAHGPTAQEALNALDSMKELWISDCLESGDPVPEPAVEEVLPSGKWVQRVPRTIHRKLNELAKKENSSLNQFVTAILAEAVGVKSQKAAESEVRQESPTWGHQEQSRVSKVKIDQVQWHGSRRLAPSLRRISASIPTGTFRISGKDYEEKHKVARK